MRTILRQIAADRYHRQIAHKSASEVFQYIYVKKIWQGSKRTRSGGGSTLENTRGIRKQLPRLLAQYNIRTLLDVPCGDFYWMKEVPLKDVNYIGGDIVKELIEVNRRTYDLSGVSFDHINLIEDKLPDADLLICRDCFVHLSLENISRCLENVRSSKLKYMLVTSFVDTSENEDILTGEWRRVNMEVAPFHLQSIEVINEGVLEKSGKRSDKSLILVRL